MELLLLGIVGTVVKQISLNNSFENKVTYNLFAYKSHAYNTYIKQDLALNNLQGLICHKTPTKKQPIIFQMINPWQVRSSAFHTHFSLFLQGQAKWSDSFVGLIKDK